MSARRTMTFDQWKASGAYVDPETVWIREKVKNGFNPKPLFEPNFNSKIVRIAQKRMAGVDALAPEHRALVHEYGDTVVKAFLQHGVTKPSTIKYLITMSRGYYPDGRNAVAPNPRPGQRSKM